MINIGLYRLLWVVAVAVAFATEKSRQWDSPHNAFAICVELIVKMAGGGGRLE